LLLSLLSNDTTISLNLNGMSEVLPFYLIYVATSNCIDIKTDNETITSLVGPIN